MCDGGYPAYPVRTKGAVESTRMHLMYLKVNYPNVLPHGRLGQFEYISMAEAIEQSLALAWRLMRDLI